MVAILTENPILARMLTLETTRHGFSLVTPESAALWLVDFDCPPKPMPARSEGTVLLGFSSHGSDRPSADLVLPLPYSSRELGEALCQYKSAQGSGKNVVTQEKKHARLSPAEAKIFSLLLEKEGQTVTKEALEALLSESEASSNVLSVHVYRLRRKLGDDSNIQIKSVHDVGYRLIKR